MNHHARRPIKTIPAAVVAANEAGGVHGRRDAFPPPLHTELIVHQEIGVRRIADLGQSLGIQILLERSRDAISHDVIFPVGVSTVFTIGRDGITGYHAPIRGKLRRCRPPCPGHTLVYRDTRVTVNDDMIVAA